MRLQNANLIKEKEYLNTRGIKSLSKNEKKTLKNADFMFNVTTLI